MKKLICLLLLAACNSKNLTNQVELDLTKANYIRFPNDSATKRIYLIHGLYGHKEDYNNYIHMKALVDGLLARDFEVIAIQCQPLPARWRLEGDGSNYLNYFLTTFQNNIIKIENDLTTKERYVGGISFGGFHSMLAFSRKNYLKSFMYLNPLLSCRS